MPSLANYLIIATICLNYLYLIVFYFQVISDIRILNNANKIEDLDKWALKYVKKYNFNNDIILENLIIQIKSDQKNIKVLNFCFLLVVIFVIVHFTSKDPYTVHIFWKTINIVHDQLIILNGIMILCLLFALSVILLFRIMHKRNIVAHEQFSRIFKEEDNSQNNVASQ